MTLSPTLYILGSFTLCGGLCLLLIRLAPSLRLMDKPDFIRKFHQQPTPRTGGIAIWLTLAFFLGWSQTSSPILWLAGVTLMTLVGLIDDLFSCSATLKLLMQFFIAIFFVSAAGIHPLPKACLSIFWIVLLTNSFNYMDNSHGLCAGVSLWILLGLEFSKGLPLEPGLVWVLAGTLIGFLALNFPSGKIFLGDTGSHLLGSMAAFSTVLWNRSEQHMISSMLFVFLPVFDFVQVTVGRIWRGQPFWVSDPTHLTHHLIRRGFRPQQAVLFLWAITLLTVLIANFVSTFEYPK